MREVELSTARCIQVTFLGGPGCGRYVRFAGDHIRPPSSGQKTQDTCACSTVVGSEALCPIKVAMKLHKAATQHNSGSSSVARNEIFLARSDRKIREQDGGHNDVSEVGEIDSRGLPSDGARLPGHWSASHGSGWC